MKERRTKFNIIFKDKYDWYITLYTTEPKTENEITSLISYWVEVNGHNFEDYSPCDIMDDICDNNEWYWTDTEIKTIIIDDWY